MPYVYIIKVIAGAEFDRVDAEFASLSLQRAYNLALDHMLGRVAAEEDAFKPCWRLEEFKYELH